MLRLEGTATPSAPPEPPGSRRRVLPRSVLRGGVLLAAMLVVSWALAIGAGWLVWQLLPL